jgi:DNA (cytosine-5)-methyltransferase 1
MTFGSLFAGIGGMDLGLERAGMECRWQVEIDPFCQKVLTKHWPNVPKYGDIRELTGSELEPVDLIAGGFPCQDVSNAGTAHGGGLRGLDGERSGLWHEFYRLVRVMEPKWVLVENVGAATIRGLDIILWGFSACRYDAAWAIIPAGCLGAPHIRKRMFIAAMRQRQAPTSREEMVQDSNGAGLEGDERSLLAQPNDWRQNPNAPRPDWWDATPRICRGVDGIPNRVDRIRSLGNAVVPQVAEWIGRRIIAVDSHYTHIGGKQSEDQA